MQSFPPSPGPVTFEATQLLRLLKNAELIDVKWGDQGMLCGWSVSQQPKILQLAVRDEAEAWVINRTKEALSAGDEALARSLLFEIADENRCKH